MSDYTQCKHSIQNVQFVFNYFFKLNTKRLFTYFFCLIRKSNKKNQETNMLPRLQPAAPSRLSRANAHVIIEVLCFETNKGNLIVTQIIIRSGERKPNLNAGVRQHVRKAACLGFPFLFVTFSLGKQRKSKIDT
jgi:hypothetical protein